MRIKLIAVVVALLLPCISACSTAVSYGSGIETTVFTDSAGRAVVLPKDITRVAPSGSVATMILATICPDYMVCVSSTPSSSQYKYLPDRLMDLPTTGQLYGSRSTINLESLIGAAPQVIIDLGDRKDSIASDMDSLQSTTGIATVFIEADLVNLADAYRSLGTILGLQERADALASFVDETMDTAARNRSVISDSDRVSVMYTSGPSGLSTNAAGSVQAQVIDLVGANNAIIVDDVSNAGGGNIIDLEQLYNFDPDAVLFSMGSIFDSVSLLSAWSGLSAVKNSMFYEIPELPYNWMASPPSVNMILGIWWLGNLIYPDVYDYDMVEMAQRVYDLLWGYALSTEEAHTMLANSTLIVNNR